jgi:hypothetical protein
MQLLYVHRTGPSPVYKVSGQAVVMSIQPAAGSGRNRQVSPENSTVASCAIRGVLKFGATPRAHALTGSGGIRTSGRSNPFLIPRREKVRPARVNRSGGVKGGKATKQR